MKHIGKYKIPEYAICAIEYGDYSGLDEQDERFRMDLWLIGTAMSRRVRLISRPALPLGWPPTLSMQTSTNHE